MRTLDRYIAASFLKNFALAVLSLTCLYLFQALLGDLLDNSFPPTQLLYYNLLNVPSILVQMAPPSVLIGTVLTLSGLNRNNELTACFSIGVGLSRILVVVVSLVFLICCTMLILQDRILPPLYKTRTTYYWRTMKKRTDFFLDVKQNKIWYRSKNLIYNLRAFDSKTKSILGMTVYTFDGDFNLLQTVDAERATFTPNGWTLLNGTVTVFSKEDQFPQTQKFQEKGLLIAETPKDFQEIEKEVDGLRIKDLYRYIKRTQEAGTDTKSFEVKLWSRLSQSFIPLVMCFLGVPFSTRSRREGGAAKDLGMCLGFTFFYWLFYSIGLSLGTNGAVPPVVAAWLPSMIFAVIAAGLIARQQK